MATPKTASAIKPSPGSARSKKGSKSLEITLHLSSKLLQRFVAARSEPSIKEESDVKMPSSTTSSNIAAETSSPGEIASESNSNTPAPSAAEGSSSMPPPTEAVKKDIKKGVKRTSAVADGIPKPRGKPGPKKKAKLEDGTIAPSSTPATAHKLGPKANQGAINAGLRALDRSGKPCRKWQKGGFQIKSFTGKVWEIPRWRAPAKLISSVSIEGSASDGSSKENKDSSRSKSEQNSNSAAEVDGHRALSIPASSPAPVSVPIAAA